MQASFPQKGTAPLSDRCNDSFLRRSPSRQEVPMQELLLFLLWRGLDAEIQDLQTRLKIGSAEPGTVLSLK